MFRRTVDDEVALALLEEHHAPELFQLIESNRAYLRAWLPWLDQNTRPEHTAAFIRASLAQFAARDGLACGILVRGALAGVLGLHRIDWANRRTSIGYWLSEDRQGRGVVTRACAGILDYVFGELALHLAEIACAPGNAKSRAVPERLGFTREGTLREREWLYDHFVDHVVYAITADEWEAGHKQRSEGSARAERRGGSPKGAGGQAPLEVANKAPARRSGPGTPPSARG